MPSDPESAAAKRAVRERVLTARRDRSPADRAAAAAAIGAALLQGLAGVGTLASYVPEETEPGHGQLPGGLDPLRARVLLPVVPEQGRELSWAVDSGRLVPGRFGLLEPVGPRLGPGALGEAEAVVVPALAVSGDGVRLGRGGGYYDRALRHARPGATLVAVVFDDELLEELPAEPHDLRVTAVVTPSGGWRDLAGDG